MKKLIKKIIKFFRDFPYILNINHNIQNNLDVRKNVHQTMNKLYGYDSLIKEKTFIENGVLYIRSKYYVLRYVEGKGMMWVQTIKTRKLF